MQRTRESIVKLLRNNGGLATDDLSERLGISATAVRRHLGALAEQDMVFRRKEQRGVGRPCYIYSLARGASGIFPQSYAAFVNALLQDLSALEREKELKELLDRRQERRQHHYLTRTTGKTLSERVASLARLLESEGRLATWQQWGEDHYVLREHNCPFLKLVKKFDYPCQREIALLEQILDAEVRRVSHVLAGDVTCVYEIKARSNFFRVAMGERIEREQLLAA
jgi:predicted ArsR family transcriptional regulator